MLLIFHILGSDKEGCVVLTEKTISGRMTNNAKFVEYKGSAGKFPLNHMKKRLEKAYFVRSEYANFANKR